MNFFYNLRTWSTLKMKRAELLPLNLYPFLEHPFLEQSDLGEQ